MPKRLNKAPTPPTASSADRTSDYARAVGAGVLLAGPHVRNSCRRHLDDLNSTPQDARMEDARRGSRPIPGEPLYGWRCDDRLYPPWLP